MASAHEQMEIQSAVRINAQEMEDVHHDMLNWERRIKEDEKRNKSNAKQTNVDENCQTSRVDIYKTEGNNCFKRADFAEAIKFYTKAIAADRNGEHSSVLYCNRSMCHLKLENFEECVIDCNDSLRLDANNEKAYFRRMSANDKLNNHQQALKDCNAILKMNPRNTVAQEFLKRAKAKDAMNISQPMKEIKKYKSKLDGLGKDVNFIQKPAHKQSRDPMKRINIVDDSVPQEKKPIITEVPQVNHKEQDSKHYIKDAHVPDLPDLIKKEIDLSFIEVDRRKSEALTGEEKKDSKELENHAIKSENVPQPPTSSAMFFNTWKNLTDPQARYHYLKSITPTGFSALVSSQLDSNVLSQMLQVLADFFVRDRVPVIGYLRELSASQELPILSMMMSATDRLAIQTLVDFTNQMHQEQMQAITKAFSI